MYVVELRGSKDTPFRPLHCNPDPTTGQGPWELISPALRDDLQAWDAMFQASWNPERGWFAWDKIGEVYRRVGPRLRERLRQELNAEIFQVVTDTPDP